MGTIYISLLILFFLYIRTCGAYSLVDNDHENLPHYQNENIIHNPYHGLSETVTNKFFLHKLNVWRSHYRNLSKEQIVLNKKRFEFSDSFIVPK